MPVLNKYEIDVFVSYASGYDKERHETPDTDLRIWSLEFSRLLKKELEITFYKKDVRVFDDSEPLRKLEAERRAGLRPFDNLTDQLQAAVHKAAFMIFLLSPQYYDTSWCDDERKYWTENLAKSAHALTLSREMLIRILPHENDEKDPVNEKFPWLLRQRAAGEEIDRRIHSFLDRARPYGWPKPSREVHEFKERLEIVVTWLADQFKALDEQLARAKARENEAKRFSSGEARTLFVPKFQSDAQRFDRFRSTLLNDGFVPMPDEFEPEDMAPEREAQISGEFIKTLKNCDAIAVLPRGNSIRFTNDLLSMRDRRNSARARYEKLLPSAVVDDGGAEIADRPRAIENATNLGFAWLDVRQDLSPLHNWLGAR